MYHHTSLTPFQLPSPLYHDVSAMLKYSHNSYLFNLNSKHSQWHSGSKFRMHLRLHLERSKGKLSVYCQGVQPKYVMQVMMVIVMVIAKSHKIIEHNKFYSWT